MAANKTVVTMVLLVLAAGAGYWFFSLDNEPDSADTTPPPGASVAPAGESSAAGQTDPLAGSTPGATSADLAKRYQCPGADMDCANSPNVAASAEEARWLLDHGYPTLEQIRDLKSRSTADYEAEYRRTGSKVAQTLWAFSLSTNDEVRKAITVLGEGVQQGNVFAYYVLSDIYTRSPDFANLTTSAAYLRAAYLAGDSKAGTMYAQKYGHLSPPEHANADKVAFEYFTKVGKAKNYPRP